MIKKTKVLALKSQQQGLHIPAYIAMYLGLEHFTAPTISYVCLAVLFIFTTMIFLFRKSLYTPVTIEELLGE